MKDICEATHLSGEDELEVSQKSSLIRPFLDQRSFFYGSAVDLRQIPTPPVCALALVDHDLLHLRLPHKNKIDISQPFRSINFMLRTQL